MSSYSTGRSSALHSILQVAGDRTRKWEQALKAAEERADRKEHQTGQRPDPHNSSNVAAARTARSVAEECLRAVLLELRSDRYAETGYQTLYGHSDAIGDLIAAHRGLHPAKREEREAAKQRFDEALENCIRDEWAEQRLVEHRRSLILKGEADPLPEDSEWLTAYAANQQAIAEQAAALAESLAGKAAAAK